jgi:hypothetical protein
MAKRKDGVDRAEVHAVKDAWESLERQAGDADKTRQPMPFEAVQRRERFVHDLIVICELNVMALDQVHKIHAQPFEALTQATLRALGGVIVVPLRLAVSADLRGEVISVARDAVERLS